MPENFKVKITRGGMEFERQGHDKSYSRSKITRGGSLEFEKRSGVRAMLSRLFKRKKSKVASKSENTGDSMSPEKRAILKMGGWNDEDIKRMSTRKNKKISTEGGYLNV